MPRMLVFVLPAFLGLLGLAAAKPPSPQPLPKATPAPKMPKLDPAWANQLQPIAKKALPKGLVDVVPDFKKLRRMSIDDKASALKTKPDLVSGPLRFTARSPFVDERHFLELVAVSGSFDLRTRLNYVIFRGSREVGAYQPRAELHFVAAPGRRYLLECAVDAAGPDRDIVATDGTSTYSVNAGADVTLLFRPAVVEVARDIVVHISSETADTWYLDGCELSWNEI